MSDSMARAFYTLGWRFLARLESVGEVVSVRWTHPHGIAVEIASPRQAELPYSVLLQRQPTDNRELTVKLHLGNSAFVIRTVQELDDLPALDSPGKFWGLMHSKAA